jgi:hypothetical protein
MYVNIKKIQRLFLYVINKFNDMNLLDTTDTNFLKGLQKLYNLKTRPTPGKAIKLTAHWKKNATIGSMMCFQLCHYA